MRGIGTCNMPVWDPVSVSAIASSSGVASTTLSATVANSTIRFPSNINVCNAHDGKRMQPLC